MNNGSTSMAQRWYHSIFQNRSHSRRRQGQPSPGVELLEDRTVPSINPTFIAPLAGAPYRDWGITEYVDHDPNEGDSAVRDYKGGAYTYDGHTGTDISLKNFAA